AGAVTSYGWDGAVRVLRKRSTGVIDVTVDKTGAGAAPDEHVAMLAVATNGTRAPTFPHLDRQGSVFAVSDAGGVVKEWWSYTAWGEPTVRNPAGSVVTASPTLMPYGYHGAPHDLATRLVDMRFRVYRPSWGRFVSPDPLGLVDGSNRFAFVGGAVLSYRDPWGLSCENGYEVGGPFDGMPTLSPRNSSLYVPPSPWEEWLDQGLESVWEDPLSAKGALGAGKAALTVAPAIASAAVRSVVNLPNSILNTGTALGETVGRVKLSLDRGDTEAAILAGLQSTELAARGFLEAGAAATPAVSAGASGWAWLTRPRGTAPAVGRGTGAFLDETQGGAGLGRLADRSIQVTEKGLGIVEGHLAQFGALPQNTAMVARLRQAHASGARVTGADASFYLHEVTEATMMARGLPYQAAHAGALAKYGVSPFSVYAPEVVAANPGLFNSNWFAFWGLQR
ncbi:MAG: RHS repeat-associated core domain-containing protein, partial [Dermatophilaceae bacterium]|nr:RHS repeat-associated core domain-containing protein [Dermatophilaceae bacterium]